MSRSKLTIYGIQSELDKLASEKTFAQAQKVILSVISLLDSSISTDDQNSFQLFTDGDGKIRANGSWFYEDKVIVDRKATYKIHSDNKINIDFKLYGITKPSKRTISWIQALTPNFEDEPFNSKFNVGIDFVVPKSVDRVIIVLSNQYVIRTLELKGTLTATYQEILTKWAEIGDFENKKEAHSILWESFDLQPINKKFYAGISERFITLRQHLTKEGIFDNKHASLFANRLIGRVIFCWFLDKKGVINPDKKYFNSESFDSDNNYYRKNLENLFFGVLNTPIADREYKDDVTPFLNGGLFEARETDLYKSDKLTFPKNYFDDLFEFLSGYNFTTDESTSQFQQVAIDPEMLGRIFENLLAEMTEETGEQARKAKGAFYTPREIVDYMCRESLREYLKTKIPEDQFRDQRFYQLIDAPDKDFQDQDHNWRRDWKPYKDSIIKAIDELKVLDPACGSGAFPIGMMQLLVRVYERLEARFDSYKTKLQIIEKNIYGVDIEPMAIEIARLRTWLSIIVDEESDSKKIKPLPNLEFKFVCANSLIDLDQSGDTTFLDDPDLANKMQQIRDGYFNTESLAKKRKFRNDYEKLINRTGTLFNVSLKTKQLETYKPFENETSAGFFDPEFMFGVQVFDVVMGNPPYVQLQKFARSQAQKDLENQNYTTFVKTGDLYCLFYERGLGLTKKNTGLLCYITSNKWMSAGYGEKLRLYFSQHNPILLLDLGGNVFESATVDSNILLIQNAKNIGVTKSLTIKKGEGNIQRQVQEQAITVNFDLSDSWFIGNAAEINLKKKIEVSGKPLKDWDVKIYRGILTGLSEAFIIDNDKKDELIFKDPKSVEIIKPLLRGRDIKRYQYQFADIYILMTGFDTDIPSLYPTIFEHLKQFEEKARKRDDQGKNWYNLRSCAYYEKFEKDKIVWSDIATEPTFSLLPKGYYFNNTAYMISGSTNPKYLLAILNSKVIKWLFPLIATDLGENGSRYFKQFVEMLPIPTIDKPTSKKAVMNLESLIDQITSAKKSDPKANTMDTENQIDHLVYELYGLTSDEIKTIETK